MKYLRSILAVDGFYAGNRPEITVLPIFFVISHYKLFTKCFYIAAEHIKSSWFVAATTFIRKSQIEKSVMSIITGVFAAVEICATAK